MQVDKSCAHVRQDNGRSINAANSRVNITTKAANAAIATAAIVAIGLAGNALFIALMKAIRDIIWTIGGCPL